MPCVALKGCRHSGAPSSGGDTCCQIRAVFPHGKPADRAADGSAGMDRLFGAARGAPGYHLKSFRDPARRDVHACVDGDDAEAGGQLHWHTPLGALHIMATRQVNMARTAAIRHCRNCCLARVRCDGGIQMDPPAPRCPLTCTK